MIDYEYVWLDLVGELSLEIIAKLKAIYGSEYGIYLATLCPGEFRRILIENNIRIERETYRNMISLEFKEHSIKVMEYLKKEGVEVIGIMQKEYPRSLRSLVGSPNAIYLKTNARKIQSLKLTFSTLYKLYMLELKNEFKKEILDYILTRTMHRKKKRYVVANTQIIDNFFDILGYMYTGVCKAGDLEFFVLNKNICKEKIMLGLVDGIVIARINNIESGIDIVDYILEEGRDVFAVPGNILYRENYLANHVIKQGAYVVTNKYDMKNLV